MNKGKLVQVIGSVFDAQFKPEQIPAVYNALEINGNFESGKTKLILVFDHIPPVPLEYVRISANSVNFQGTSLYRIFGSVMLFVAVTLVIVVVIF